MDRLESPINLNLDVCLWVVGGSWNTWREPKGTQEEHANDTQKGPSLGPSFLCGDRVYHCTTVPPLAPHLNSNISSLLDLKTRYRHKSNNMVVKRV